MKKPSPPTSSEWLLAFLRVPLFLKIVLANTILVTAAAISAAWLAPTVSTPAAVLWIAGGLVVVVGLNGLLVHYALLPLREIEEAARRIEEGQLETSIPVSPLADRRLSSLADSLGRMLDSLAAGRDRQFELSARVLEAEESERKRIAHELFDETAQLLSSVLLRLRIANRALPEVAEPECGLDRCRASLDGARDDARAALAGIQRIARGLRPPELDELGVSKALEAQLRQHAEGTGVEVRMLHSEPIDALLTPAQALAVYRIVQEGFSNALRHGRPAIVSVRLQRNGDAVAAELDDDGQGFDAEEALRKLDCNVGLLRMHERARFVGGELAIDSTPGGGTRVRLVLPLVGSADTSTDGDRSPATQG